MDDFAKRLEKVMDAYKEGLRKEMQENDRNATTEYQQVAEEAFNQISKQVQDLVVTRIENLEKVQPEQDQLERIEFEIREIKSEFAVSLKSMEENNKKTLEAAKIESDGLQEILNMMGARIVELEKKIWDEFESVTKNVDLAPLNKSIVEIENRLEA